MSRYPIERDGPSLPDVSSIQRLEQPRPVQLLLSFKVGVAEAGMNDALKRDAATIVGSSGLFTAVDSGPASGGAILSIVVERFPGPEPVAQDIAGGLTLGLIGATRTDAFVCTADYVPAPAAEKLTATAEEAQAL